MKILKELIIQLASSKKVAATVIGILAGLGAKLGLPEEHALTVATAIWSLTGIYVGGQAVADHGKSKAEVEAKGGG